jgi:hypothetical protein
LINSTYREEENDYIKTQNHNFGEIHIIKPGMDKEMIYIQNGNNFSIYSLILQLHPLFLFSGESMIATE